MDSITYLGHLMPSKVHLVEVAPRDGLQNLKQRIPTEVKKEFINQLADAGLKEIEVTSFVHPKAIPQMEDASEVARYAVEVGREKGFLPTALVPNLRGAQSAWEAGLREVNYVISVSQTHNKENINRSHEESVEELAKIREAYPTLRINVALATVFGCPFEAEVTPAQTLELITKLMPDKIGVVTLSDTIGVAVPGQISDVIAQVREIHPELPLGLHVHDTHGRGLLNVWTGLLLGVNRIEVATGGLGGCPFAPGAAGNLGTEDIISLLDRSGIESEVSLSKLLKVVEFAKDKIEPNLLSHLSQSRSYEELSFFTIK